MVLRCWLNLESKSSSQFQKQIFQWLSVKPTNNGMRMNTNSKISNICPLLLPVPGNFHYFFLKKTLLITLACWSRDRKINHVTFQFKLTNSDDTVLEKHLHFEKICPKKGQRFYIFGEGGEETGNGMAHNINLAPDKKPITG